MAVGKGGYEQMTLAVREENSRGLAMGHGPVVIARLVGHSQVQLDEIAENFSIRLRECLGLRTPNEVWSEIVSQNVALNS